MYALLRPWLFRLAPETSHDLTLGLLAAASRLQLDSLAPAPVADPVQCLGLTFPNRVGLAAGLDKDARAFEALGALGFGFLELGTVTPLAQPGNPKPRMFRLPEANALINRMGFNNGGLDEAVLRLMKRKTDLIIGGNIGKNKVTPNEEALNDYLLGVEALHPVVDYFVVNVSSPNTPNLRELQEKEPLTKLLKAVQEKNNALGKKPLLLKIAPDLNEGQLDDIIDIINSLELDGIVATNTTISRDGLRTPASKVEAIGAGGLSGKVLRERSTEVIAYLRSRLKSSIAIIAVGGIFTGADAKEKLNAGADLVQVWTGFLYEGPAMVRRMLRNL